MEYVTLGTTGLQVSELCLGTWRFGMEHEGVVETGREEAHELLDAFADRGGNFIDTANGYGGGDSERWIGEWLADRDREDYVIASKCYWSEESRFQENLSRKNVHAEIRGSLDRLDTDYLDILYIHRFDDDTPIEVTLRALDDLVSAGKINYIGASTMAAWKLTKALYTADIANRERFRVTQPLFHAAYDEPEVNAFLEVCADQDLAVCPYSPLAGGFLTGKYERTDDGGVEAPDGSRGAIDEMFDDWYVSDHGWDVLTVLRDVAAELGATPAQVALRWLMDRREVTCVPIVGARTVDQIEENVGAADLTLTEEHYDRIEAARVGE